MANDINISWGAQNLNIAMQTQEINVAFDGNIFNEPVTFSNGYIYIAYASDTNGTGFSTTPSGALKYIGVLNTTTLVNDLDASYYVDKWFKYIGDDGAGAEGVSWGSIVGSILDQLDLQTALNGKANTSHTHTIENVTGLQTALDGKQATLGFTPENSANKGQANGFAPLDATGKVPLGNMPASLIGSINYQGSWDASTNTPALSDGTGSKGLYYIVGTGGSQNLGSGAITFDAGDWVVHNGTIWQRFNDGDVSSVNGQNGVVVLDTSHINDTADKRYVTDTEKTKLANTSNTNTGDQDAINVPYDPGINIDITATDVQGALDQVDLAIQSLYSGRQSSLLWQTEGVDIAPAGEAEVIDFASGVSASYNGLSKKITFDVAPFNSIVNRPFDVLVTATNFNSILTASTRYISGLNTYTNNPLTAGEPGYIITIDGGGGQFVQLIYSSFNALIYYSRLYNGSVWSAWNTPNILSSGVAEVDFGPITQETDRAKVSIPDVNYQSTQMVTVSMRGDSTTDHDPDDYLRDELLPMATNFQDGVGFDIVVKCPNLTYGKYKVSYIYS